MVVDENANTTVTAPGPEPSILGTPIDINTLQVAHVHAHEDVLRKTNKNMCVTLEGELRECKVSSMAKCVSMPTLSKTHDRAAKMLFRVFVNLGWKKQVTYMGGGTSIRSWRGMIYNFITG